MRTISLAIFIALITAGCNNSKDTKMKADNKEIKQDAISSYATVNGIKMYYEIHQPAEPDSVNVSMPLVLIHGGGSTIQTTFSNVLPLLAKHYKVIAVELQAHGRTDDRDTAESFKQDADDVAGLLAQLKIDKANFFGFSNGGNTAMQIAVRHSGIVNKLIIASSFYKREGMIPGFFEGLQKATLNDMPALLKTGFLHVNHDKNKLQTMFNKDRERMVQFKDWTDETMRSIKAPALLIAGDRDVVTPEHSVEMLRVLPHAQLVILPGAHGEYLGEVTEAKQGSKMPGATVAIIEEFLNE